jgi:hypothetical protein
VLDFNGFITALVFEVKDQGNIAKQHEYWKKEQLLPKNLACLF